MKTLAGGGGEAGLEIIMSYSRKHYSALTVNGPGHLYEKPGKLLRMSSSVYAGKLGSSFSSLSLFPTPSRIVRSVYEASFLPGSGPRSERGRKEA